MLTIKQTDRQTDRQTGSIIIAEQNTVLIHYIILYQIKSVNLRCLNDKV